MSILNNTTDRDMAPVEEPQMAKRQHEPPHPGLSLKHFIEDSVDAEGKPLSLRAAARGIGVTAMALGNIMKEKKPGAVTPTMALRLAKYFKTTAQFWTTMQADYDLHAAEKKFEKQLAKIKPVARE